MATRRYSINPGDSVDTITIATGSAVATKTIELTVELATTAVNDAGSTRALKKGEIYEALEKLQEAIIRDTTIQQ